MALFLLPWLARWSPQAKYLALHTKKTEEQILADFQRPRYFNPYEAVDYGLIDTVRC